MAVVQPPDQLDELERVDEILLQELQRMDELLLEELERVDEMLLRIVAAIDQLPVRIASTIRRKQLGSVSGNGTRAAEPARSRASTRPFDPYGEDEAEGLSGDKVEIEAAEDKESAARQVARKVQSWVAAYGPDREALRLAPLSLAVALLATAIAVVALIVAVLQ
jgi:hypothetical protein